MPGARCLALTLALTLASPAAMAAEQKLPEPMLKRMLAIVAAVQSSCSQVRASPALLTMLAHFGKDAERLAASEKSMAEIRSEMSENGEMIAKIGCGRYADFWNDRAKQVGLNFPLFVRD